MEIIEWPIKNQNANYKKEENASKETSINISKEIYTMLGSVPNEAIITVKLRKQDFLKAFSNLVSNLPLYYYKNGIKKATFNSEFFENNYKEINDHFGNNEIIDYKIKIRINDESTVRYYMYRIEGADRFIIRDFLIGENSVLIFEKDENGDVYIKPEIRIKKNDTPLFDGDEDMDNNNIEINNDFAQTIYYGVPGSGKSFEIDRIIKEFEKQPLVENVKYTRRVVFHPEYTNADFIGQILPEMEGTGIKYNFIPGNFTKILKDAYRNPNKKFALVIEEINRGNAAAIFGDVFQLLDRLNETESDYSANDQFTYTCGWSKYGIDNTDIIHEIFKGKDGKYEPLFLKFGNQNLKLNYNSAIRLPPNLSIYATMNTSDQNVFTLDNAFQRRWDMQLVKNECTDSKQMDSKITVNDTYITWKDFQVQINKVIGEKSNESGLSSMEDKRLGCWFVKAENGIISAETFANKVLKYLWDDAFKFYHTEIFKDGIKNFEDLQKEFLNIGFDVFNDVCELTDKIHKFFTFNFDKE